MGSRDQRVKDGNRALDKFKRDAIAHFGIRIECLILTGSYARHDARTDSDIDLWLLLDSVAMADLDAIGDLIGSLGPVPELNVQCTTFAELGRFGGAMNLLQLHVEGKILHGSLRFDPPSAPEIRQQARRIAAEVLMSARHYLTARESDTALAQGKLDRFVLKPLMLALRYETRARTGHYPNSLSDLSRLAFSEEARSLVDIRRRYLDTAFDRPYRPIIQRVEHVARALLAED